MASDLAEPQLTPRQAAFVAEYLIDLNGTQAAIRAGYSPNGAEVQASELLRIGKVAEAIARGKAQRLTRVNITADSVLNEMSMLAMSRIDHYVVTDDGQVALAEGAPPDAMAAIQSIKRKTFVKVDKETGAELYRTYDVEIRLWNKPEPLKLMGKHAGVSAFTERVEVTGRDGGPIEIAAVKLAEMPAAELRKKMLLLTEQIVQDDTEKAS